MTYQKRTFVTYQDKLTSKFMNKSFAEIVKYVTFYRWGKFIATYERISTVLLFRYRKRTIKFRNERIRLLCRKLTVIVSLVEC